MGAVAVELVHLASLYHDDVIDEATIRRNVESVNSRFGNLVAIVAGDYLLARSAAIAASLGTEVAELLADTLGRLCQGQVTEVRSAFQIDRSRDDYFAAISGKTAALTATSCRIGALTGGLPSAEVDAMHRVRPLFRHGVPDPRRHPGHHGHRRPVAEAGRPGPGRGHLHPAGARRARRPRRRSRPARAARPAARPARAGQGASIVVASRGIAAAVEEARGLRRRGPAGHRGDHTARTARRPRPASPPSCSPTSRAEESGRFEAKRRPPPGLPAVPATAAARSRPGQLVLAAARRPPGPWPAAR